MRECFFVTDTNLSQEQLEKLTTHLSLIGEFTRLREDGNLVKKPIVATVDAKLLPDAYPPDEVIHLSL